MHDWVPDPFLRARVFRVFCYDSNWTTPVGPKWVYEVFDATSPRKALATGARDSWQDAVNAARFDLISQLVDQPHA